MNFSLLQLAVAFSVPALLSAIVWRYARSEVRPGMVAWGFLLGAMIVWPVIQLGNLLASRCAGVIGHYYLDELIAMTWTTALPEEVGKGLVALLVVRLAGPGKSPAAWLTFGAAAHSGFAALEGVLGALGNEGFLKVQVGRSLGALSHCSWGIIMMWFLWKGWLGRGPRWGNCAAAVFAPVLLHATTNASLVEVPGMANLPHDAAPPPAAILIMLSGIGVQAASVALAIGCLIRARRINASI